MSPVEPVITRSPVETRALFLNHSIVGIGSPEIRHLIFMGLPSVAMIGFRGAMTSGAIWPSFLARLAVKLKEKRLVNNGTNTIKLSQMSASVIDKQ